MFVKHKSSGDMIEVLDLRGLLDPFISRVTGRYHAGEEMPEPELFNKADLMFPSGEPMPRCWVDGAYRSDEVGAAA